MGSRCVAAEGLSCAAGLGGVAVVYDLDQTRTPARAYRDSQGVRWAPLFSNGSVGSSEPAARADVARLDGGHARARSEETGSDAWLTAPVSRETKYCRARAEANQRAAQLQQGWDLLVKERAAAVERVAEAERMLAAAQRKAELVRQQRADQREASADAEATAASAGRAHELVEVDGEGYEDNDEATDDSDEDDDDEDDIDDADDLDGQEDDDDEEEEDEEEEEEDEEEEDEEGDYEDDAMEEECVRPVVANERPMSATPGDKPGAKEVASPRILAAAGASRAFDHHSQRPMSAMPGDRPGAKEVASPRMIAAAGVAPVLEADGAARPLSATPGDRPVSSSTALPEASRGGARVPGFAWPPPPRRSPVGVEDADADSRDVDDAMAVASSAVEAALEAATSAAAARAPAVNASEHVAGRERASGVGPGSASSARPLSATSGDKPRGALEVRDEPQP